MSNRYNECNGSLIIFHTSIEIQIIHHHELNVFEIFILYEPSYPNAFI